MRALYSKTPLMRRAAKLKRARRRVKFESGIVVKHQSYTAEWLVIVITYTPISQRTNSNHIMVNYWDTVWELRVRVACVHLREGESRSVCVSGWVGKEGKRSGLSGLMLYIICLGVITFKARSIQRRQPQCTTPLNEAWLRVSVESLALSLPI